MQDFTINYSIVVLKNFCFQILVVDELYIVLMFRMKLLLLSLSVATLATALPQNRQQKCKLATLEDLGMISRGWDGDIQRLSIKDSVFP